MTVFRELSLLTMIHHLAFGADNANRIPVWAKTNICKSLTLLQGSERQIGAAPGLAVWLLPDCDHRIIYLTTS
jgi:hypothetical protein